MKTTRSEKSLSLLCHKFLSFYPMYADSNEKIIIHLDNMAEILEVERRRIYDIVNVLESVEILSRFCKNQYIWHGYAQVPYTLSKLKTLSVKSDFLNYTKVLMASQLETSVLSITQEMNLSELTSVGCEVSTINMLQDTKPDFDSNGFELHKSFSLSSSTSSSSSSVASVSSPTQMKKNKTVKMKDASTQTINISREEKSLGIMSQKFLMLFLTSQDGLVSINFAARVLLGDTKNDTTELGRFKTKIRRLYDIASVLSSIGLIKKYHYSDVNISKPAYKYIGPDVDIIRNAEYVLDFQNSGNPLSNSKHSLFDHFKRNLNLECNIPKFDINTGILASKSTKSDSSSSSATSLLLQNTSQISINTLAYEKLPLKCQFDYNINQNEFHMYSAENDEIHSNSGSNLFCQEPCSSQYHQSNYVEYNQLNHLHNYEYVPNVLQCENNTNLCQYSYSDQYDLSRQENYLFDDSNARQRTIEEQKINNLYFEKKNYLNHESRIIQSSFLESYHQEEFQPVQSIEQSLTQNSCQSISVLPSFNTLLN